MSGSWTEWGPGIGVTHRCNPEVSCSGAHACPSHLKIVSLTVTLLRTALRKSLAADSIYQDQKRRFGKRTVLLTLLVSLIHCLMPRLLFDFFASVLKMRVLISQFFISKCYFDNLLGGWDRGAYKTQSRTQKEEM